MSLLFALIVAVIVLVYWRAALAIVTVIILALLLLGIASVVEEGRSIINPPKSTQ